MGTAEESYPPSAESLLDPQVEGTLRRLLGDFEEAVYRIPNFPTLNSIRVIRLFKVDRDIETSHSSEKQRRVSMEIHLSSTADFDDDRIADFIDISEDGHVVATYRYDPDIESPEALQLKDCVRLLNAMVDIRTEVIELIDEDGDHHE